MGLQKGDVVLVNFPFTDFSQAKLRPAIVLWISGMAGEATVCFVSSRKLDTLASEEFIVDPSKAEFQDTGLKVASKVRVTRIVTLEGSLILRRLGKLGLAHTSKLNQLMRQAFQLL